MKNIRLLTFFVLSITILWTDFSLAAAGVNFLLPDGTRIEIVEAKFDNDLFKVVGCDNKQEVCFVNDKIPFGSDSEIPRTYVKSITASLQGRLYSLDASNMYNAWGGRPLEVKGSIRYFGGKCSNQKNCQFRGIFSDGAGSFVAEWKIVDGVSVRTVLTNSVDVIHLFMDHIDPPEFY